MARPRNRGSRGTWCLSTPTHRPSESRGGPPCAPPVPTRLPRAAGARPSGPRRRPPTRSGAWPAGCPTCGWAGRSGFASPRRWPRRSVPHNAARAALRTGLVLQPRPACGRPEFFAVVAAVVDKLHQLRPADRHAHRSRTRAPPPRGRGARCQRQIRRRHDPMRQRVAGTSTGSTRRHGRHRRHGHGHAQRLRSDDQCFRCAGLRGAGTGGSNTARRRPRAPWPAGPAWSPASRAGRRVWPQGRAAASTSAPRQHGDVSSHQPSACGSIDASRVAAASVPAAAALQVAPHPVLLKPAHMAQLPQRRVESRASSGT